MKKFLSDVLIECGLQVSGTTALGTATATTVATSDNSTNIATTAWVKSLGYTGYTSWNLKTNSVQRTTVQSGGDLDLIAGTDISISYAAGGKVTITSTATGSVDYISNVALNGSSLDFTGVGTAFTGSIDLSGLNPTVRTVYETVKNVSGAPIQKGTPLAVVPGQTSGNLSDVVPADASDPARMPAIFIANADIADEAEGEAVLFGNLKGVDTSLYPSGTTVYVAAGGGWTATKPVWPNLIQNLGVITKQHPSNGAGIVTGVGRANALPNLTAGKLWVGSAAYPIESTTVHVDEANGRVGIGTTSPIAKLAVEGAAYFADDIYLRDGATASGDILVRIYDSSDDGAIDVYRNNSVVNRIHGNASSYFNAGNVGIGTTSPAVKLEIQTATSSDTSVEGLRIYNAGGGNGAGVKIGLGVGTAYSEKGYIRTDIVSGGAGRMFLGVNGGDVITINNSSNVGIGTTSPNEKLEVAGNIRLQNFGRLYLWRDNNSNYLDYNNWITNTGATQTIQNGGVGGITFKTLTDTRMFISSSGNVGIGTTSPGEKLHVVGAIKTSRTTGATENTFIYSQATAKWGSSTYPGIIESVGNNSFLIGSSQNTPLHLVRSGTIALTIGTGGNVGIGTTGPASNLHVVGNVQIEGGSTSVVLETNNKGADPAGAVFGEYDIATTYGAIVDYVIYDAGRDNMRSGTFSAVWNAAETRYNDVSTVDIGDTSVVTLTSQINGANVELIVTGDAVYTIKFNTKLIK